MLYIKLVRADEFNEKIFKGIKFRLKEFIFGIGLHEFYRVCYVVTQLCKFEKGKWEVVDAFVK